MSIDKYELRVAACPGRRLLISGSLVGICIACARQGQPGEQIKPAAHQQGAQRVWVCVNRAEAA